MSWRIDVYDYKCSQVFDSPVWTFRWSNQLAVIYSPIIFVQLFISIVQMCALAFQIQIASLRIYFDHNCITCIHGTDVTIDREPTSPSTDISPIRPPWPLFCPSCSCTATSARSTRIMVNVWPMPPMRRPGIDVRPPSGRTTAC